VSKGISNSIGKISVHGLLAADLSAEELPDRALWKTILPSKDDILGDMPLVWNKVLQDLLPGAAKALLKNQQRKYQLDWTAASKALPNLTEDLYLYNWLIVNTRTFYWVSQETKHPLPSDDCMALNPVADYFNHADEGCTVEFGSNGFTIFSDRVYEKGEEIFISYGKHSNDFLLTEYGFILSENTWDEIRLDHVILPEFSTTQLDYLSNAGFLGNYILDQRTVCHRTQVALRLLCMPLRSWYRFVSGEDDGEKDQGKVNQTLLKSLRSFEDQTKVVLKRLTLIKTGLDSQRDMLRRRWQQIHGLLEAAIMRIHDG
jgi:hypothetical protein